MTDSYFCQSEYCEAVLGWVARQVNDAVPLAGGPELAAYAP
jgi:hypothetical protein